ncbi:sporulation transcription regulator, putative [Babesia ovata]|uniref:Sporulation transcription regulator, putative n=1 Tax=Babesia ovata TaxID=189622 RepID=A0A2H6KK86_9APIC|nr:sporulation transcription regulator, putative [Babesia ovata]GBE63406.1 sporulation transcription regulator, putative [Babesia ovata]
MSKNIIDPTADCFVELTLEKIKIMLQSLLDPRQTCGTINLPTCSRAFRPLNLPNLSFNIPENIIKILLGFKLPAKLPNRRVNFTDFFVKRTLDMRLKINFKLTRRLRNFVNMFLIQVILLTFKLFQLTTYNATVDITSINLLVKLQNIPLQTLQITLHFLIQSLNFQLLDHTPYPILNLIFHTLQIPLEISVHFHNSLQCLVHLLLYSLFCCIRRLQKVKPFLL